MEKDWSDFGVLIVLQLANGFLGWYEDMKAGDAVQQLKDSLKATCTVQRNGNTKNGHPVRADTSSSFAVDYVCFHGSYLRKDDALNGERPSAPRSTTWSPVTA